LTAHVDHMYIYFFYFCCHTCFVSYITHCECRILFILFTRRYRLIMKSVIYDRFLLEFRYLELDVYILFNENTNTYGFSKLKLINVYSFLNFFFFYISRVILKVLLNYIDSRWYKNYGIEKRLTSIQKYHIFRFLFVTFFINCFS